MSGHYQVDKVSVFPIEKTLKTPGFRIVGDVLEIYGRSIPENSIEFYEPVIEEVGELTKEGELKELKFTLEYFNCSSSKCILDLLKAFGNGKGLEKNQKLGKLVSWNYETDDENMLDAGEDYESVVKNLPFRLSEIEG